MNRADHGWHLALGGALVALTMLALCGLTVLNLLLGAIPATDAPHGLARASKVTVQELTFLGGHRVASDSGVRYSFPSWRDTSHDGTANQPGEDHFPVCYTRGSFVRVMATIRARGFADGRKARVVGLGTSGLRFETTAEVTGGRIFLLVILSDRPLPDAVRFYDPFRIDWKVSLDGGTTWLTAGATENRLYATLADPKTKPLYETLLDIGCRNAGGLSDASSVIAAVWNDFANRNADGTLPGVKRKAMDGFNQHDGIAMRYWFEEGSPLNRSVSDHCHQLRSILDSSSEDRALNGVGTCQAWTELFEHTLRAQGIVTAETVVVNPARAAAGVGVGFLMKTRAFLAQSSPSLAPVGVADLWEVRGQGTPNPPRGFVNHFLLLVEGAYYDPSYGTGPFRGATDDEAKHCWERVTLGAFVVDQVAAGETNRVALPLVSSSSTLAESWMSTRLCRFDLACAK